MKESTDINRREALKRFARLAAATAVAAVVPGSMLGKYSSFTRAKEGPAKAEPAKAEPAKPAPGYKSTGTRPAGGNSGGGGVTPTDNDDSGIKDRPRPVPHKSHA